MIQVKFFGGAKKSFSTDEISIDKEILTVKELLDLLVEKKSKTTPDLDVKNLLIAINGVDSSALKGKKTKLKNNDVVSIIPIIHGGAFRIQFKISTINVELIGIKSNKKTNVEFLDNLRKTYPKLVIQAVSTKYILNKSHAKKIITISLEAKKNQNLLSKKLETDILMRFACTTQISQAISAAGIKPNQDFIIVTLGNKSYLEKLFYELKPLTTKLFSKNNSQFLQTHFKISKKQVDSVLTNSPLEDLLVEKAAILF